MGPAGSEDDSRQEIRIFGSGISYQNRHSAFLPSDCIGNLAFSEVFFPVVVLFILKENSEENEKLKTEDLI
jgi:hypothetical protein